jgi:hypothetical protein
MKSKWYQLLGVFVYKLTGYSLPHVLFFKADEKLDILAENVTFVAEVASSSQSYAQKLKEFVVGEKGETLRKYLEPYSAYPTVHKWPPTEREYTRKYAAMQLVAYTREIQ